MSRLLFILAILTANFFIIPVKSFPKNFETKSEITAAEYGAEKIEEEGNRLGHFLFTYIMPLVAIISGAYGVISAFLSSSLSPLIRYGGISIACIIMPYLINGISNASSVLLDF